MLTLIKILFGVALLGFVRAIGYEANLSGYCVGAAVILFSNAVDGLYGSARQ